jgi:putative DNA primase/helicase
VTDPAEKPAAPPDLSPEERIAALVRGEGAAAPPAAAFPPAAANDDDWESDLRPPASPAREDPPEGSMERGGDDEPPDDAPLEDLEPPPEGFDPGDGTLAACAREPMNDIGNSRRLRLRHGADILFVPNLGWHYWDATRWFRPDNDEDVVRRFAHPTAEAIALEAYVLELTPREREAVGDAEEALARLREIPHDIIALDDEDISKTERRRRAHVLKTEAARLKEVTSRGALAMKALQARQAQRRRFATSSGNSGKLDGMLGEARPYLAQPLSALDADPLALGLANGTLRFEKSEEPDPECPDPEAVRLRTVWRYSIRPHARGDLMTKRAPAFHCPEAKAPRFMAFLERCVPDPEVRAFLQRWFGYCLTALTGEQAFCIFYGEGKNGKSTLVDIIARVMGDYATTVPVMSIVSDQNRKGSEATPDLIRLPAARFVRSAEPKEGLPLDESFIKDVTGSEPINVRRLHHEFIEVYPFFKLVISCNRKPRIYGNDDGIWRRVILVPFEVQIPEGERDKALPKKLQAEMPGILNWMIDGALDYLGRGALDPPEKILAATQEYRDESDVVGAFVRAALELTRNPHDTVEAGELYAAFAKYCERSGLTPLGKSTFNRRMPKAADQFGIEKGKASVSYYSGVRIRAEFGPSHTPFGYGAAGD